MCPPLPLQVLPEQCPGNDVSVGVKCKEGEFWIVFNSSKNPFTVLNEMQQSYGCECEETVQDTMECHGPDGCHFHLPGEVNDVHVKYQPKGMCVV